MVPLIYHLRDVDLSERGSVRALCDRIAEEGVKPEDGRAFATWLEALCEELDKVRTELLDCQKLKWFDDDEY